MLRKFNLIKPFVIIVVFHLGCNKQSEAIQYDESIITEELDGYSRDLHIYNDTLFVVNEVDGLLIYKLELDSIANTVTLDSIYSDSVFNQEIWNLSGILFADKIKRIILLDEFYCTRFAALSDVFLEGITTPTFQDLQCAADNHHSSRFTINNGNEKIDIFTLVRKVSSFSTSDLSSIYQNKWIDEEYGFEHFELPVIDSLNYDLTDVHYMKEKLVISHTNDSFPEYQIYSISETEGSYADMLSLVKIIEAPAIPNALYSTGDTLFVGMGNHGGVLVYNLENVDNIEEISWFATGFSVKEIYWDSSYRWLTLSCGYQGVVVLELDGNMMEVDSWILNTSYAYAARNYMGNIIVATRKGLEIITLNINQ